MYIPTISVKYHQHRIALYADIHGTFPCYVNTMSTGESSANYDGTILAVLCAITTFFVLVVPAQEHGERARRGRTDRGSLSLRERSVRMRARRTSSPSHTHKETTTSARPGAAPATEGEDYLL